VIRAQPRRARALAQLGDAPFVEGVDLTRGLLVSRVQVSNLRHEIQNLPGERDIPWRRRDQARDGTEAAEAATQQAIEDARRAGRAAPAIALSLSGGCHQRLMSIARLEHPAL